MQTFEQARPTARALSGYALIAAAVGMALFAAFEAGDELRVAATTEPSSTTTFTAAEAAPTPALRPRIVKASLLPLPSLPSTPSVAEAFQADVSERDVECLTRAVYFEARGDSEAGLQAVAQVVLNRSRHPAFPKTVCGVINQGVERGSCQFSFACKPTKVTDKREWARARRVAERALSGEVMEDCGTATFFHAARINPGWGKLTRVGQIGLHVFYRYPGSKGAPSAFRQAPKPSLLDSLTAPIQAALHKPAVETATPPPAPVLTLNIPTPAPITVPAPAAQPAATTAPVEPPAAAHMPPVTLTPVKLEVHPAAPASAPAAPAAVS